MREIKIQIPEDVVNRIQLKDFEAVSMQAVITNMLESHALDADTTIIESPVFVGYQNRLVKVRKEFEEVTSFWLDKGVAGFRLDAAKEFYTGNNIQNMGILLHLVLHLQDSSNNL